MTTIFCQKDCVTSLIKLKKEDESAGQTRMHRVTTLVTFESDIEDEEK